MTTAKYIEELRSWFELKQRCSPELNSLVLRPCSVSHFREAYEVAFITGSDNRFPLILSCFGSKIGGYQEPVLHDLQDPMRLAAQAHTVKMVDVFMDLVDKVTVHYVHEADFFKQHIRLILKESQETTVVSADRNHLTLLVWYQGERGLVPAKHTYNLDLLKVRENDRERLQNPPQETPKVDDGSSIQSAFVELWKTKHPKRRALNHMSLLAYCSRILRHSKFCRDGLLTTSFEDGVVKVSCPTEGVSLEFEMIETIPLQLLGTYEAHVVYRDMNQALENKGKLENEQVWHFLRLPLRFNDKPSKRAIAYRTTADQAKFYHPLDEYYLEVTVNY